MNDIYDVAVISVLVMIGLCIVGLLVRAWLVAYRYYRNNRPMATRVTRSRWEDSRQPDSRDVMAQHWRIVGRK